MHQESGLIGTTAGHSHFDIRKLPALPLLPLLLLPPLILADWFPTDSFL